MGDVLPIIDTHISRVRLMTKMPFIYCIYGRHDESKSALLAADFWDYRSLPCRQDT